MYIELFLLDNLMMNMLVLRLACALCARPCIFKRIIPAAVAGTAYAWLTLAHPLAGHWLFRLVSAALICLSIPSGKRLQAFFTAWGAVLLSACMLGGITMLFAYMDMSIGSKEVSATSYRSAMLAMCVAAYLPVVWRRRRGREKEYRLCVAYGGKTYELAARLDSGNSLREPLSGLPVIVADIAELKQKAAIPIPAATVQGSMLLYALKADLVTIDGLPTDALIALSESSLKEALVPPSAIEM